MGIDGIGQKAGIKKGGLTPPFSDWLLAAALIAFSSEVDSGSRQENALEQKVRASVLIPSEPKKL
ncbi:hypothetical protein [Rhodopseudomonas faecalis]|uniref:hypothetical protein n=1 Tax=Rhodopseudomonas faecalis TaxID=99655 RepID=UPI001AECAFC7|nr:hypothetical protein [Rhodopseudomonas faecalis]